ncbi:MAG: class I tRNA ligase family protein, partial [Acidobacteriota bacterium]
HPDPDGALEARLREARQKCRQASPRDRPDLEAEVRRLEARRRSHLPTLRRLVEMARQGRSVRLPLLDRPLPLILDEWAKPELGSGCVKITPAHDPNDYQVWLRHQEAFGIVNILNPDGTLNASAGAYQGLDRFAAREKVLQDLEKRGLVEAIEQRSMDVALSDRSKTVIEPYVSRQWFVRMGDVEGGITCGGGTPKAFTAPGLAQAALDAVREEWSSASGLRLSFHPDPQRYRNTYVSWLSEKRDWCISRQLWWGHRIPVWSASLDSLSAAALAALETILDREDVCVRLSSADGGSQRLAPADLRGGRPGPAGESAEVQVALRDPDAPARDSGSLAEQLEEAGFQRDPDVLDTWFSSGLWPHSTLGWPEPESAPVEPGQSPLGEREGEPDCLSFYYPGSCLVTGRDIITLWIVRMVVMGLYNLGDLPFKDVFIHATILDGKGERMSKSKGNGIDPEDIIERYGCDAMRYVLSEMQTGTQDVRLPVQAISPYTGKAVDLAAASHGKSIFTYLCPETGKEFDVLGTMPDLPAAKLISERFEVGRNFCNKLWNASRFALMNLDQAGFQPCSPARLLPEDRWILSRLAQVIARVNDRLEAYNPAAALAAAREFFWGELCDWYLEMIKGRLRNGPGGPQARQVLAVAVDQVLRLLHPFVPFITEVLWGHLNRQVPRRGIEAALEAPDQLIQAPWPRSPSHWIDRSLEEGFRSLREIIHAIRDLRSRFNVPPRRALEAHLRATGAVAAFLETSRRLLMELAGLDALSITGEARRTPDTAAAVVGEVEVLIRGVVDPVRERARLTGQRERLARDLASLRRKLANAGFLSKAPADVVERQRARAADLEGRIEAIDAHLETLA